MTNKCFECNRIIHAIESPHFYGGPYATNTRIFCSAICLSRWLAPYLQVELQQAEERVKRQHAPIESKRDTPLMDTPKPQNGNIIKSKGNSALVKDNLTSVKSDCSKLGSIHKRRDIPMGISEIFSKRDTPDKEKPKESSSPTADIQSLEYHIPKPEERKGNARQIMLAGTVPTQKGFFYFVKSDGSIWQVAANRYGRKKGEKVKSFRLQALHLQKAITELSKAREAAV